MKHPVIIGAGGVASYLLLVLLKTFRPEKLTIVDKDVLEERNLDRQMFHRAQIGQNKARALMEAQPANDIRLQVSFIEDWFTETTTLDESVDAIICCADNHMARHAAILRAQQLDCYAYIGGNEYLDSQAFVYHPSWSQTARDPLVRYPNIAFDETGSPTSCQGAAQVASPQLAIANMNCAAKLLHLLWVYERWVPENVRPLTPPQQVEVMKNLPCELFSSLTVNEAIA